MSAMPDLRFFLWAVFVMVAIACLDNVFGVLSHVVLLYSPRFDLLVPSFDLLFLYSSINSGRTDENQHV